MATTLQDPLIETKRIDSIDMVRGLIMVVMALDHVRDYFHHSAQQFDATDLSKTYPLLFITRLVTHFCAPTFMLLSGLSVYLNTQRKSKREMTVFLLTRGFWFIVLEITVLRFGFLFNMYYDITFLTVLWVIGSGMIIMAGVIHLRDNAVLFISLLLIVSHNALSGLVSADSFLNPLWTLLFRPGVVAVDSNHMFMVGYPILPWTGIIMFGYAIGRLYKPNVDAAVRKKKLLQAGITFLIVFVALRLLNLYDDTWMPADNFGKTVMSFVNVTKYPPSLQFTLMTIGPVLMLLAVTENLRLPGFKPLVIIGSVPLFYFIAHFYIAHAAALVHAMIKNHKSLSEIDFHLNKSFGGITPEDGVNLGGVYLAWILIVAALYPLCKWYSGYKKRNKVWWLSYL